MKYRLKKILEVLLQKKLIGERVSPGNKVLDAIIVALFFLGIFLLIWQVLIYRQTIIQLRIPLLIWLIPGIILTPILFKKLNHIDGLKTHWMLHFVLHSCTTGAFILFGFMATNYYFADTAITTNEFQVLKTGSLAGRSKSAYVVINYKGMDKQLVFPSKQTEQVIKSEFVLIEVRKGKLGYDILENYKIK